MAAPLIQQENPSQTHGRVSSAPLRFSVVLAILALLPSLAATAWAQAPVITDAKTSCIPSVPYPIIDASIANSPEMARLYFRSGEGKDFYYVTMTGEQRYQGVLLVPAPGTESVVYYVEAINEAGDTRSLEYTAKVADDEVCSEALLYQGTNPGIVVHSASEGAAAIPQGFLNTGVATSVSAAGVASPVVGGAAGAAAGGLGAGAIAGISVAGAAGAVVIADELDDEGEEPTSPGNP